MFQNIFVYFCTSFILGKLPSSGLSSRSLSGIGWGSETESLRGSWVDDDNDEELYFGAEPQSGALPYSNKSVVSESSGAVYSTNGPSVKEQFLPSPFQPVEPRLLSSDEVIEKQFYDYLVKRRFQ